VYSDSEWSCPSGRKWADRRTVGKWVGRVPAGRGRGLATGEPGNLAA
jgi:hypothetical protein